MQAHGRGARADGAAGASRRSTRAASARRTDWQWFGGCDTCDALPGKPCLDQRNRLTATIEGQDSLRRPHPGRERLNERLLSLLSPEAVDAVPEICARLEAEAREVEAAGNSFAGSYNREHVDFLRSMIFQLKRLAHEPRTSRTAPWITDDDSPRATTPAEPRGKTTR